MTLTMKDAGRILKFTYFSFDHPSDCDRFLDWLGMKVEKHGEKWCSDNRFMLQSRWISKRHEMQREAMMKSKA
jgi:hypothetical protein